MKLTFVILPCVVTSMALSSLIPAYEPCTARKPAGPLSPREELATFQVAKGFKVELVAAEPDVIDPVAMAFDGDGRLFVVEMRGYPNAGVGEGKPVLPGRVKLLEDRNGDGYFEHSTVYVDDLRFPTGVTVWRGGILVGHAPDLIYCKDTNGDGKADVRKVLYTGFGIKNIQQLLNGLQFHFDNWIHGCNGSNDSVIQSVEKNPTPGPSPTGEGEKKEEEKNSLLPPLLAGEGGRGGEVVALRGRHFRFKPDVPGSLEPMSGGGQYGLASDDWGNWFTCTNSQHLRHIVLPDHYLKRNPHLAVPAVVLDIPDRVDEHHAAAKVYRISPFEPWRVDRTGRRVKDAMGRSFAATELVPGGYITSACGLAVDRSNGFPPGYFGNVFVCDPANNLIHRDVLVPDGPTFKAERHDKGCEFLASTDTWFRPCFLCQGPDGAMYVADFYREVIETPLSLPDDIQKQYNLQSRERGRIWRISSEFADKPRKPALSKATNAELVKTLSHTNAWWRLTAQRLLIERQAKDGETVKQIEDLAFFGDFTGRTTIHALWTLEGLGVLKPEQIANNLGDLRPGVRVQVLRLAEPFLAKQPELQVTVLSLAEDASPQVRFQVAFTLGSMGDDPRAATALTKLARRDGANPWMQTAILSSALPHAGPMLRELVGETEVSATFASRLAALVAAKNDESDIRQTLWAIIEAKDQPSSQRMMLLDGLAHGLARQGRPLARRMEEKSALSAELMAFLKQTADLALAEKAGLSERLSATRLLGHGSFATSAPTLEKLLTPQTPAELQVAAVQALSLINDPKVGNILLTNWASYSPAVRREVQEKLLARPEGVARLLTAMEKGQVLASQLDLPRREQLLKHANKQLRERAKKVLADQIPADRKKVLEEHKPALDLAADATRGRAVFKKHCITCHRLENEGVEVGPDLLSALKTKTRETLFIDILDPSREADTRYLNYVVSDKAGRIATGIIASETASSLVLRRADKAEDTLLRADIDEIQSTAKSLMPEGFEKQMSDQELADVIEYLVAVAGKK